MVPDSATVIDLDDQNTVFELKEMDANVIDVEKEAMCNGSVEFSGSMRFRGRLNLRARKRPDIFTPAVEPPSKRQKTGSSEKASAKISRKKKTPSKEENQDVAKEVVLPNKLLKKEEASFEEELTDEKPSKSTSSSKKKKIVRAKVDKAIKGLKQKARKVKEERVEDESTTTEADEEEAEEPEGGDFEEEEEQDEDGNNEPVVKKPIAKRKGGKICVSAAFPGKPIPQEEAKRRWPLRYQKKAQKIDPLNSDQEITQAVSHYEEAEVDHAFYKLGDCVTVNAGDGPDYLGRVVEFFKAANNELWFTAQWFFHLEDTAVGQVDGSHDEKRIFYSEVKDDNLLECITGKIKVVQVSSLANFQSNSKNKPIPPCDYYYDMGYSYSYSTFYELSSATAASSDEASSVCNGLTSSRVAATAQSGKKVKAETSTKMKSEARPELKLLDLYSGCGGMSTGLGMGCNLAGANLITRWALDLNEFACQSLKYNHPETEVRNEDAESFLNLIKEWQKLCGKYPDNGEIFENDDDGSSSDLEEGEYEVEKIIGIRWGSPEDSEKKEGAKKKKTIQLKVHWKGYGEEEDSWEPIDGLESAQERIKEFVILGQRTSMLPLPGKVDVICGGPPCQGASGFNRFRKVDAPLECPRNRQMKVYMDIVEFLRPRFILMENVVDILKFAKGFLGRFALSRLVNMHYQAKLGLMVAGCYGLPQFRMRVFLWGAAPTEKLPPFPLPTHNVVQRGGIPNDWERNVVAYDETQRPQLQKVLHLGHAISDLPPVGNAEKRNEMAYDSSPKTPFQHYIRSPKDALYGVGVAKQKNQVLYDHRPLQLNNDDYQRVCQIPKRKGANFRDLTGVRVRSDNVVELDPDVERVYLASGKPLVPDYAISFVKGKSIKPFARLWWDETVPTVVTRAEPHNQQILHPEQDRVLTIRENARLQGFPDYYKLFGPVKQKYIQIGNAVAVPVGRALGYSLGLAIQHECPDAPVIELPKGFPQSLSCPAARGLSGPETTDEAVATVVPLED